MIRTKAPISAAALNVPRPIHLATVSALPLTTDERYGPWVRFGSSLADRPGVGGDHPEASAAGTHSEPEAPTLASIAGSTAAVIAVAQSQVTARLACAQARSSGARGSPSLSNRR